MSKISKKQYTKLISYRDYLNNQIYRSKLVSIEEFYSNPYFLGNSFSGGKTLYPCWKKTLKELFQTDDRYIAVLTGSTGIGKTVCGLIGVLYVMYRHLEMRDIWKFYDMAEGGRVAVAFFNLTKSLSSTAGFNALQGYMLKSEYFRTRGSLNSDQTKIDFPEIEFLLSSPNSAGYGSTGRHIIAVLLDELDSPNANSTAQRKVLGAFNNTIIRLEGRFLKNKKTPCRAFLVSSKQENASFLNNYIMDMQKDAVNASKIYIADFKRWEVLPKTNFCGETFQVSCGDTFNLPRFIKNESDLKFATEKHHQILDVPIEYLGEFSLDLVRAIRDVAGMSVEALKKSRLFPNSKLIDSIWDNTRENPVTLPTIEIGANDDLNLIDFIDFSKFNVPKHVPRFIHTDIAFSHDALGLTMSCLYGNKDIKKEMEDGTFKTVRVPCVHVDFIMRIKAKKDDSIPLHKIRKLVLDLREVGFNIRKYTSDLILASKDTFQLLNKAGIPTEYFSMDQPITNYIQFRDLIMEGRINCFPHRQLKMELTYLEYDRSGKGKIDHPDKVRDIIYKEDGDVEEVSEDGAKDLSDSTGASAIVALENGGTAMDVEGMQNMLKKIYSPIEEVPSEISSLMKVDGKAIVQVGEDNISKLANIMRNLY